MAQASGRTSVFACRALPRPTLTNVVPMLYLHCGWPRTGTSSFQETLSARAYELSRAGVLYPTEWRPLIGDRLGPAHHCLAELLGDQNADEVPLARFQADLRSWGGDVFLSSEAVSNWVVPWHSSSLFRLLDAACEVASVTLLWTLRRIDEFLASMYLHQVLLGTAGSPQEFYEHRLKIGWIDGFIGGSAEVACLPRIESVYTKYERDAGHCADMLKRVGVGWNLRRTIMKGIRNGPRTGERLTQKAAVALVWLDEVSQRAGVEVDRGRLVDALHRGELTFQDDCELEIVGLDMRRLVHEVALDAARESGYEPYLDFFAGDVVEGSQAPSDFDLDRLTTADIDRLVRFGDGRERSPRALRPTRH